MSNLQQIDKQYVAGTYNRFPVELDYGKGSMAFGTDGERYIDMTSGIVLDPAREPFVPAAHAAKTRIAREYSRQCLNQVYQSGKIRYTIGTDANHSLLYKELEFAVEGGASTLDAVKAVTVNAAKMCGLEKKTGQLSAGLKADIIAVDENPLDNVSALKDVSFVMKSGKVYKS